MTRVLRCSSAAQPGEKKNHAVARGPLARRKTQPSDYSTRKINHHILITQKRKWTNRKNFKNFGTPKSCERKKIEIYKKRRENECLCCFFPGRRMLKSRWTCFLACRQRTVRFIDHCFILRYSIFKENVRIGCKVYESLNFVNISCILNNYGSVILKFQKLNRKIWEKKENTMPHTWIFYR